MLRIFFSCCIHDTVWSLESIIEVYQYCQSEKKYFSDVDVGKNVMESSRDLVKPLLQRNMNSLRYVRMLSEWKWVAFFQTIVDGGRKGIWQWAGLMTLAKDVKVGGSIILILRFLVLNNSLEHSMVYQTSILKMK